jgi:hypothetical protein
METGISNEAVAVLSLGSGDELFMKKVMTNKIRKILGRLKLSLRRVASRLSYLERMECIYS